MSSLPLGQLFLFGFPGTILDIEAKSLLTIEQAGGVILFKRNIESLEQTIELNRSILECSNKNFPIISVDQEGGLIARLKDICSEIPSMQKVGNLARSDERIPKKLGAMMAREMVALGFHLDFAPVVDVDTNVNNPIIGNRSFSHDPLEVAKMASEFIRGMQGAGLAACAKHFPGHGDTTVDSHLALPVLDYNLEFLLNRELLPFKSAIEADVASIMTAHIVLPKIDAYPATLSRIILHELLRVKLGFKGVVISDDLEMKAVADHYEVEELVKLGLLAGVDLFIIGNNLQKTQSAIAAAHRLVDNGIVPLDRARDALSRVAQLKEKFLGFPASPSLEYAKQIVRCPPHLKFADSLQ